MVGSAGDRLIALVHDRHRADRGMRSVGCRYTIRPAIAGSSGRPASRLSADRTCPVCNHVDRSTVMARLLQRSRFEIGQVVAPRAAGSSGRSCRGDPDEGVGRRRTAAGCWPMTCGRAAMYWPPTP